MRAVPRRIAALALGVGLLSGCSGVDGGTPDGQAPDGQGGTAGQGPTTTAAAPTTSGSPATPSPVAEPTPESTPGKGPPCDADRCFSVAATGDLLLHPGLWDQAAADAVGGKASGGAAVPFDFEPLLSGQREYLDYADLGICHLETPVAVPEGPFSGYPQFNVPPQILEAAKAVGYDACTTASNHTIDAGTEGLTRTLDVLDGVGLEHTGSYADEAAAGEVLILETPAARVAVIQATYGLNGLIPEQPWQVDLIDADVMTAKARQARAEGADVVIAAIHAGDEYATLPNAQQVEVAHALADSGEVDFIYGHHTHSVLPIEKYNDTWIVYGLGNGVSELSPVHAVNNEGLMIRAQFAETDGDWSVSDLAWLPSIIVSDPYRWCALGPNQVPGTCTSPEREAEVSDRIGAVVDTFGAVADGAHPWDLANDR
ncbi:CapA family protein [Arthrobacter sp. CAL618]|uniref:CapA family protein n=1 Tax=Arthrobacter sp. CAL618 TaxID=1055770 RepID=UPI00041831C4|nr:CapA family protein [Arthrobacter sp. CAL618]